MSRWRYQSSGLISPLPRPLSVPAVRPLIGLEIDCGSSGQTVSSSPYDRQAGRQAGTLWPVGSCSQGWGHGVQAAGLSKSRTLALNPQLSSERTHFEGDLPAEAPSPEEWPDTSKLWDPGPAKDFPGSPTRGRGFPDLGDAEPHNCFSRRQAHSPWSCCWVSTLATTGGRNGVEERMVPFQPTLGVAQADPPAQPLPDSAAHFPTCIDHTHPSTTTHQPVPAPPPPTAFCRGPVGHTWERNSWPLTLRLLEFACRSPEGSSRPLGAFACPLWPCRRCAWVLNCPLSAHTLRLPPR